MSENDLTDKMSNLYIKWDKDETSVFLFRGLFDNSGNNSICIYMQILNRAIC